LLKEVKGKVKKKGGKLDARGGEGGSEEGTYLKQGKKNKCLVGRKKCKRSGGKKTRGESFKEEGNTQREGRKEDQGRETKNFWKERGIRRVEKKKKKTDAK